MPDNAVTVFSATSSAFPSQPLEENVLQMLTRDTRHVDSEDVDTTTTTPVDPCDDYIQCALPDGRWEAVRALFRFAFRNAPEILNSEVCSGDFTAYTDCLLGDQCTRPRLPLYAEFNNRVLANACDHVTNFTSGIACWDPPFRQDMRTCARTHRPSSPHSPEVDDMLACFVSVPRQLEGCTQQDAEFVASFMTDVLGVFRELTSKE